MRFWRLVASRGGLFHLPENTFLKKSVAKAVVQKVPSPETRINTRVFGTSKPRELFPLDGAGGFGGYIVNYAVYVFYLVCDTI